MKLAQHTVPGRVSITENSRRDGSTDVLSYLLRDFSKLKILRFWCGAGVFFCELEAILCTPNVTTTLSIESCGIPRPRNPDVGHPGFVEGAVQKTAGHLDSSDSLVAMVMSMVVSMVVVMVFMIFVVPVAFMELPAFGIVVVMRVRPISARIWRPAVMARNPTILASLNRPEALHPNKSGSWRGRGCLVTQRRRRRADVDRNLCLDGRS